LHFSNFGSLKSTETDIVGSPHHQAKQNFSNFGSLKSTETHHLVQFRFQLSCFSNFGSLKSTETRVVGLGRDGRLLSAISAR